MINSTLCYIEQNGKYLMLFRNKKTHDVNGQKWVGVGGKFEPGETAEQCLVREVKEETGLDLLSYHYYGVINFISDEWEDERMHLFLGTAFSGNLIPDCPEGELHWVPKEEIMDLPMWEGDPYFLKEMLRGAEQISMTLRYEGENLVEVF